MKLKNKEKLDIIDLLDADPDGAGAALGRAIDKLESEMLLNQDERNIRNFKDAYQLCFIARRIYNIAQRIKRGEK